MPSSSFSFVSLYSKYIRRCFTSEENKKEKLELLKGITIGRNDTSNVSPLQQEVLKVWGEQDRIFPVQLAHEPKEVISKNAILELLKETPHVPQMEKPGEFNNIILNFLQGSS
ncbi:hypothetical protein AAZX31_04G055400 [Glycine max]|uniref:AB hydrolase-1 domain-containing protein n=2 Tax=Glycine subgen. Soja TaxID=1462606 RepID=K7KIB3_SOYBN|nr:hypothetical protein GYH30_009048 [Glycine max]RZC15200.1 hypothetical protein D0Y65_008878 [Glycine soja]